MDAVEDHGTEKGSPDGVDFFTSTALVADPYPFYDELRECCPVQREPHHDVVMVTGYDEALAVYRDTERFSSCMAVTGPFPGFPVPLEGDDVSDLIEQHRDDLPFSDQLPTFDPPKHTVHRGLLMRLLTPGRLKENEDSMWALADAQLDEFVADGRGEIVGDYAGPFAMLVIADLLGVPAEDHDDFRRGLGQTKGFGSTSGDSLTHTPLEFLYEPVHRLCRGPQTDAARRRADPPGPGHLQGRLDPRGPRRGATRGQPVRGRTGDHCPAAGGGGAGDRRGRRAAAISSGRTRTGSPTSSRRSSVSRAR